MIVQDYLRAAGPPEAALRDLLARYAVKHKRHPAYPHLVLLKYDQFESPFAEPIVRECRGVILDESRDWAVVSRAFDKFFNHGESHAASIDWPSARVQEKLDGSLCVVYEYDGRWHVATSGTPDASGDVCGAGRFADYFWATAEAEGIRFPEPSYGEADLSFFFELTGPSNRVVVVHTEPRLTLLGARDRTSGVELYASDVAELFPGAPRVVPEHPLTSIEEVSASFASLSPLAQEGYVVVDRHFARIKVKHPGYGAEQ